METIKQQLHKCCLKKLEESISSAQQAIDEARETQKEETKSSAGDKFETSREMMTQEIEKGAMLAAKLSDDKNRLLSISTIDSNREVQQGSVVFTNNGNFYLAISVGVVIINEHKFQTVSLSSPIGQLLLNKKAGQKFHLHEKEYVIEKIF